MLFQHPWDVSVDGEDEGQPSSVSKEDVATDTHRFENLSIKLQRSFHEKNMMLGEIQSLKNQLRSAAASSIAIDVERESWNRLIQANMRSGIMACVWCMKAQVVKITAMAFHKWKAFQILDIRMKPRYPEKISIDTADNDAMMEAAAAAAQYFRDLMSQISPGGKTLIKDTDHADEASKRRHQGDGQNHEFRNVRSSSMKAPQQDNNWRSDPYQVRGSNNPRPFSASPERTQQRTVSAVVRDQDQNRFYSKGRGNGNGIEGERNRSRGRGETMLRVNSSGDIRRRAESPRHEPSPLYMTPTTSFSSKLKKIHVHEVKKRPEMRAGSVTMSRPSHNTQRNHSFGSSYNASKYKADRQGSALRDYEEYGEDVPEYISSAVFTMGDTDKRNASVYAEYDPGYIRNGHGQPSPNRQRLNVEKSRDRDREVDRSRDRVRESNGERDFNGAEGQRQNNHVNENNLELITRIKSHDTNGDQSVGYVHNYLQHMKKKMSTEGTYGRQSNGGCKTYLSPTYLTYDGLESNSFSPLAEGSMQRDESSPGGIYSMPQFKRYQDRYPHRR